MSMILNRNIPLNTVQAIPNTTLTDGVGASFTPVTAFGGIGTLSYALSGGTLPTGLSFSTSNGLIIGTPTTVLAFTTFTVTVTDQKTPTPQTSSKTFNLTANAGSGATLIFSDDFTSLDLASVSNPNGRWRPDAIWQDVSQGYRDFAGTNWNLNPNDANTFNNTPFVISGSVLTIQMFRTPSPLVVPIRNEMVAQGLIGYPDPAWCGGFLETNSVVQKFKYGYFEFNARWPNPGKGMHPGLWFFSSDLGADPNNKGNAEIDVLEMYGVSNTMHTTIHLRDNSGAGPGYELGGTSPFTGPTVGPASVDTAGWHLYGMDWQPTYLRFYYDNVLMYEVLGADGAWFSSFMNIHINFCVDDPWFASFGLATDGTTPNPMNMDIDWIKVWTSKP